MKFRLALLLASLLNWHHVLGRRLNWKERAFLAFLLSRAKDKRRLRMHLSIDQAAPILGHLAHNVFLINQKARCSLSVSGKDLLLTIEKENKTFRFLLLAVPDSSRAAWTHGLTPLADIFFEGLYDFYDYKDGIVVDIGGYIGDTAVYFSMNGAKEVYSYEPNPINFDYLEKNLELNGVSQKVKAYNLAISMRRRKLIVPDKGGAGSLFSNRSGLASYDAENIQPTVMLRDKDVVTLLKVDCKGCELELFAHSLDDVVVKVMHIVVDSGRLNEEQRFDIISRLQKAGFSFDKRLHEDILYFSNRKRLTSGAKLVVEKSLLRSPEVNIQLL